MRHRALQQFLADVYWGDLDYLLMDLRPGTGDIAISVAQLVPTAEILVVTTPHLAATEVAERAGSIALHNHQPIAGVVEKMRNLPCPHCGEAVDVFGSGGRQGGRRLPDADARHPCSAARPDSDRPPRTLREGGENGRPLVLDEPDSPAEKELLAIVDNLTGEPRGLAGMSLGVSPACTP